MTRFCSNVDILRFCSPALLALALGCAGASGQPNTAADVTSGAAEAVQAARSDHLTTELRAVAPRGLPRMGAPRLGGYLYVIGGYFGQPHNYSKEFQSSEFERLDVATSKWETLP